jgi:hypothetical protein
VSDGTWQFSARRGTYLLSAESRAHDRSAEITFTCDGRSTQRDLVLRLGPSRTENVIASVVNAAKRLVGANTKTSISGKVVDEHGAPASGTDVRVVGRRFVRADANGRFEVEDLEPGEYEIIADWVGPWSGFAGTVFRSLFALETRTSNLCSRREQRSRDARSSTANR